MMYECITESLTANYKARIMLKLTEFKMDAVSLLYFLIQDTHSTNALSTRDHKMALQDVTFRKNGNSIDRVHTTIDGHIAQINSNGVEYPDDDKIMALLHAYKSFDCPKWLQHITNLESQWSTGTLTESKKVMELAKNYSVTLQRNKEWKTEKPDATALTTERSNSNNNSSNSGGDKLKQFKARHSAWKFDRSKSNSTTYQAKGKTYHWCTGPGHFGIGMWSLHDPGTCTGGTGNRSQGSANATGRGGRGRGGSRGSNAGRGNGANTRSIVANALEAHASKLGDQYPLLVEQLSEALDKAT